MPCPGCFTSGNDPIPIVWEAGWAPGQGWRVQKISPPPGFDPQTVQPTASHYTHYDILAPIFIIDCVINVLINAGGHLKHRSNTSGQNEERP
jgi:hypothetical protein